MESIKKEIQNYNALIHKPDKEAFEEVKMRIDDILCSSTDLGVLHQTHKTKEKIRAIIEDGISTI